MKISKYAKYLFLAPALIILVSVIIYPLLSSLNLSLHTAKYGRIRSFVGLNNYIQVFQDDLFLKSMKNTLCFTFVAVPLEFLIGFGLALLLNREMRFRGLIRTLFLIPMLMTPVVVGLTWRMLYNVQYGLLNYCLSLMRLEKLGWVSSTSLALFSLAITDIWQWTPFMFIILLAGLQTLPRPLYEAANIDGASKFQSFRYVTLPMLKLIIMVAILIRTIDALKILDKVYTLTWGGPGSATETISYYIYRVGFKYFNLGYAAALSFILVIIMSILAQLFIKVMQREY